MVEHVPDSLVARLEHADFAGDPLEVDRVRAAVAARLLGVGPTETRIDRFVVLGQIGVGGMGVVYAAYDPQLDRKVAIKLVRVSGRPLRPQDQERLVREARALARLSHPNVVAVYEVGPHEGSVFLAMEFVRGQTLRSYAAATDDWRRIVQAYLQAGAGLAAAHERGLVHRDFKPDNAIVGDDGRVRVVDFGLARGERSIDTAPTSADARSSGDTPLTATGTMLGTPAYMAPEQRLGLPSGPRTDQYGFCASLFEALAGRLPRRDEHDEDVASALPASLPIRLRRALARGLARLPDDRFVDMATLCAELRAASERSQRARAPALAFALVGLASVAAAAVWLGEAREPCPDPSDEIAETWGPQQRAAISAAAAELGETATATATVVERELDARRDAWISGRRDACEALYVRRSESPQLFDRRMRCLERARTAMGETIAFLAEGDAATWERAVRAVVGLPPVDACADVEALTAERGPGEPSVVAAVERVRARIDRGRTLMRLGRFAEGEALADEVVVEASSVGHRPLEAEALQLRAAFDGAQHRDAESTALLDDALWRAEAGHADELVVSMLATSVGDAVERGELDGAAALDRRLAGAIERLGRPSRTEMAVDRVRGMLANAQGRPAEAEAHVRDGIAASRRWSGADSLDEGRLLNSLGSLQFERGDYAAAAATFETVLAIHRAWLGDAHPEVLGYRTNLANTYDRLGRRADARAMLEAVVADGERALTGPSPTMAAALDGLAGLEQQAGRSDLALPLCERSVAVLERTVGRDDPRLLSTLIVLATVLADLDRNDGARAALERVIETSTRTGREDDTKAIAMANLSDLEVEAGDFVRARALAGDALALWIRLHGEDHPVAGEFTAVLARVELAADALTEATTHARRAIAQLERGGDFHAKALADARFVLARALLREQGSAAEAIAAARAALVTYELEDRADDATKVRDWLAAQSRR